MSPPLFRFRQYHSNGICPVSRHFLHEAHELLRHQQGADTFRIVVCLLCHVNPLHLCQLHGFHLSCVSPCKPFSFFQDSQDHRLLQKIRIHLSSSSDFKSLVSYLYCITFNLSVSDTIACNGCRPIVQALKDTAPWLVLELLSIWLSEEVALVASFRPCSILLNLDLAADSPSVY